MSYTTIKEEDRYPRCYRLVRRDGTNKYTVVLVDYNAGQVYCAMPSDFPSEGGTWFARISDSGIAYVSGDYSRSYAFRKFREYTTGPTAKSDNNE